MNNFFKNLQESLSVLLDKEDLFFYGLLLLVILNLVLIRSNSKKIRKQISEIPIVSQNEKFEIALRQLSEQINALLKYKHASEQEIQKLSTALRSIKKIETKKYNPYADAGVGGLQSFSTAMVDENGNGIVLSSLYSRTATRVTLKEIQEGNPLQELSPEEKEVLAKTKN